MMNAYFNLEDFFLFSKKSVYFDKNYAKVNYASA